MSSRAASPSPSPQPAPPWKVWAGVWPIYVIWGSTCLATRIMVRTVPPLLGAGLRFAVAGALMLAVLRIRRGSLRVTRRQLLSAAVVGTLLAAGGNGLVTVAEQEVPSSLAALLIASVRLWVVLPRGLLQHAPVSRVSTYAYVNPVIAVFLGWIVLSEEITALTLIGAAVIVASVAFIVRHEAAPVPAAPEEERTLERAPA